MISVDGGFTRDEVRKRYERYAQEHHGELDIPNLCETMVTYGQRRAIEQMTEFSDILPRISQVEMRVQAIHRLLLSILADAEEIEQEALPL